MSHIEKFWRDATAADVARVMNGEEVEARFRDRETEEWTGPQRLAGAKFPHGNAKLLWICGSYGWWFCQVYDPPQWWLNKPDPGEEYRLLEKFPDEALQEGDEVFDLRGDKKWESSFNVETKHPQSESNWYRRRIEPKPEPKYAVGQRVRIVGPKARPAPIWEQAMDRYIGEIGTVKVFEGLNFGFMHQVDIATGWNFHQDYLEPVVEPKHYVLQVGDTAEFPGGVIVKVSEERGIFVK